MLRRVARSTADPRSPHCKHAIAELRKSSGRRCAQSLASQTVPRPERSRQVSAQIRHEAYRAWGKL